MSDTFGVFARFYDLDYAWMVADLPMLQHFAARCGSPILELGCGTGRVLVSLAGQGYEVTGVDLSAAMLERARTKIAAEGLGERVRLVQQDMRDLDVGGAFGMAFATSSSFQHLLTLDEQLTTLKRVRRHLNPGSLLIIDLFNPDLSRLLDHSNQVTLEKVMVDPESGHRVMKFHTQTVDLEKQIVHVTFIIEEVDGQGRVRRTLFPFPLRYLFRWELELLLLHVGFQVEAVYGSYDLDVYDADSERIIAVARRPD